MCLGFYSWFTKSARVFSFALLFAFSSFSAVSAGLPDWVKKPKADTEEAMYGIGSGASFKAAQNEALSDIAGKINTQVQQRYQSQITQTNRNTHSYTKIDTNTEVAKTSLSHFQLIETQETSGTFWVLLKLEKSLLASSLYNQWQAADRSINTNMTSYGLSAPIEQLIMGAHLREQLISIRFLLVQLHFFDHEVEVNRNDQRYVAFIDQINEVEDKFNLVIASHEAQEEVVAVVIKKVTELGINTEGGDSKELKNKLVIDTEQARFQDARQAFNVTLTVTLSLYGNDVGEKIAQTQYIVKGRDYSDEEKAMQKAVAAFGIKISRLTLPQFLNIAI